MRKKKKFPFFTLLILAAILAALIFFGKRYYDNLKAFKVEITQEEINVREEHDLYTNKLAEVKKGNKYNVIDIYLDDPRYVWYKIEYENNRYGWIASGRKNPYVVEINNPNGKGDVEYKEDYAKPIIKFFEEDYSVLDIESITYDHLTIEDESDYKIKHEIYYEAHPTDRPEPQYWIKYTVTDDFGNASTKVQRIIFVNPPDPSTVKDFSELK